MIPIDKNLVAPWQHRGRWYQVFIESDGTEIKYTQGDIGSQASINNEVFTFDLPDNFHTIDYRLDAHIDAPSAAWLTNRVRLYPNDKIGIELPRPTYFDYLTLYIFGYYDE